MVEREMTETLTHRSTARPRSSQQHALACEPTFPARHAQITLTQRARSLRLAPPHDTHVAPLALPSVDAPPTPLGSPTYPSGAGLGRLITLLASEPEPDKLPASLMRDMAEQLGADGAYLFRTDAASKTLALAPWAIVDGAIQHRDSVPALEPLMRGSAIESASAPQLERYTLRHHQHPYLGSTSIARFRRQGYRVGLTLPLLAGGQMIGFLECFARDDTAFLPLRIAQEALSNSLKYADARRLTIELVFEAEQAQLRVQDDGRGFDLTQAAAAGGFGLLSMRARAVAIGAELTMSSAPGQGTSLVVALPHNRGGCDER